jgi:hypothetical protein
MYDELTREDGCPGPYLVQMAQGARVVIHQEVRVNTVFRANLIRYDSVLYTEAASSLVIVLYFEFNGGRFHEEVVAFS